MKYVFFINMGGAENLQDCDVFLKNMFSDEYILPIKNKLLRAFVGFMIRKSRLKAMQESYKHIGGKSPLNDITKKLCSKLDKDGFCFDFINLYVKPFALDVLQKYEFKEDDEVVLFPLYPHHSQTTVTTSVVKVKEAIRLLNINSKLSVIDIFYKDELYNEMLERQILEANESFYPNEKKVLLFSAHSLPMPIIKRGDLYEKHINEHVKLLSKRLEKYFDSFLLGYQSKLGPVKWLEPNTGDLIEKLDKKAIICPISFCIDCSETVFELDIEYRKVAKNEYKVLECPNFRDDFVKFIESKL